MEQPFNASEPASQPIPLSAHEAWPTATARRATLVLSGWSMRTAAAAWNLLRRDDAEADASRWHDSQAWPERRLRVGLACPGPWAIALAQSAGALEVDWFEIPRVLSMNEQRRAMLDACVWAGAEGTATVRLNECPMREAAWFDWGMPRPLSFPSVFPARMDCAQLTFANSEPGDVVLTRLLIEGAGVLSRHPARLTLRDRVCGRRPVGVLMGEATRVRAFTPMRDPVEEIARRMADELGRYRTGAIPTPAERAAARFVSAWTVSACSDGDEESRRLAAETAARVTPDESEVLFRCAAARMTSLDDEGGLELLVKAQHLARSQAAISGDQSAFLTGELDAGAPSARTTARIAAGVALVCSTLPSEKLAYFREDLADDLAHASALVGRDQDARLILEVVRMSERGLKDAEGVAKAA